jgi:hypothetical protein
LIRNSNIANLYAGNVCQAKEAWALGNKYYYDKVRFAATSQAFIDESRYYAD